MKNLADSLRVKYGLRDNPTDSQINKWTEVTQKYINQGYSSEEAGRKAASETFYDFGKYIYKGEADTIYTLLQEAKKK